MSATPPQQPAEKSEGQSSPAPAASSADKQDGSAPSYPRVSIFNLPQGITSKDDLLTLCKTYGQVVDAEFFAAKPNKAAFGFVTFKTREDAEFAIYRLDKTTLGGKQPVKAQFAQDRPKREFVAGQGQAKKPKVKKAITPLTVLTPKNLATNAVQNQNADPLNGKAGWDLNKTQQAQTQQNQQNKGPRNQKNNQGNGGQVQGQQGAPKQNNPGKGKAPAANTQAPAQNAQTAPVQNQGNQNQGQNPGQQGAGKKKRGPKGANPQGQQGQQGQPAPQGNQQRQNQGQAAPQVQANTTPAAPQQTQNQNQQQGTAQNQPQNPQQQSKAQKKRNKKKNAETQIRYRVNVVDPKNNLPLHVIELNQGQYDKFILPLVTKH